MPRAVSVDTAVSSPEPEPPAAASDGKAKAGECMVRIDDKWYDLGRWRGAHPSGAHWIDAFKDKDATEVLYAFHSEAAHEMLARMPPAVEGPDGVAEPTQVQRKFRALREKLVAEGWFEREPLMEAAHLAGYLACMALGVFCVDSPSPALKAAAAVPFALSYVTAGWLAHDYIHGRGKWCTMMRNFGGWTAGFSSTMWSNKHNMHHALTNHMDHDEDLSGGPVLFLWAPNPIKWVAFYSRNHPKTQ